MLILSKILIFIMSLECIRSEVHWLKHADVIEHPTTYHRPKDSIEIYCYEGKPKYIIYLWQSVWLEINLDSDNYAYYEGATPEIVHREHIEHRSSWSISLFSWKQKSFRLDPFNQSCIGIDTRERHSIILHTIRVDYWKLLFLLLGCTLFYSANKLSTNVLFYYLCGVSFGVCASFLILIYFISKLFPNRPVMYGVAVCGWTVGVYILQLLWENVRTIFISYKNYVMWYAFITGVISFIVCYRWGPVTNKRTQNLIRWTLQGLGLFSVFNSSEFQEAAMGEIVIMMLIYNFPQKWLSKSKTYWKRKFPPKIRLLTNTQYYQQGVTETSKALENLRKYCSSPECNQWKTALKLKNVKRFASFVEGTSHLSDDEILEYETSIQATDLTDEEFTDEDE